MNIETVAIHDPLDDIWIIMRIPTEKYPKNKKEFKAATGFTFTFLKTGINGRMIYEITCRPVS